MQRTTLDSGQLMKNPSYNPYGAHIFKARCKVSCALVARFLVVNNWYNACFLAILAGLEVADILSQSVHFKY